LNSKRVGRCFYKRRGKLHAALQYLAKALKIELTSEEVKFFFFFITLKPRVE